MAYKVNPITLATEGYQRSSGPDEIAIASHGYVHVDTGVPPVTRTAANGMFLASWDWNIFGRYDRG